MTLPPRAAALKAALEGMPGVSITPYTASRGSEPVSLGFKVMGKTFAILGARSDAFVILKCDPHLAEALRGQYAGVGHRSHLHARYWISIDLDADVPPDEVERLVAHAYDEVVGGLTKKQKAELKALAG